MHTSHIRFLSLLLALPFLFSQIGCESDSDSSGNYWKTNTKSDAPAANVTTPAEGNTTPSDQANGAGAAVGDAVPYGALKWTFGGIKAGGARQSGAQISGLHMSKGGLSFKWVKDLSCWGLSKGDASAYACLFVQKSDGSWVGGKFDWISSSRSTRDFINVNGHYNGWSLAGVPNPCNAAFVVVSKDKKKRSNVISSRWSR